MRIQRGSARQVIAELRIGMIRETSAFLSWALTADRRLPRIPRRRTSERGFDQLLRRPGGRERLDRWWQRTLDVVGRKW